MRMTLHLTAALMLVTLVVVPQTEGAWLAKWFRNSRYGSKATVNNNNKPKHNTLKPRELSGRDTSAQHNIMVRSVGDSLGGMEPLPPPQQAVEAPKEDSGFWRHQVSLRCLQLLIASNNRQGVDLTPQELLQAVQGIASGQTPSLCDDLVQGANPGIVQHRMKTNNLVF